MGSFPETYNDPKNTYNCPASRGYSLAWLLAWFSLTEKSFDAIEMRRLL